MRRWPLSDSETGLIHFLSMNLQEILSDLRSQRSRLDQAIAALEGLAPKRGRPPKRARGPRTMSLAARRRIGAAKKAWWVQQKAARKRPQISAAGRKRVSALMKARWAERKKAKR